MQKSVLSYSVPKATRFGEAKYVCSGTTYYTGTCFEAKGKGTSFGFGERKPYPLWMERNMKEYPAPNTYLNKPSATCDFKSKGFSFGLSYRHYEKTGIFGAEPLKKSQTNGRLKTVKSNCGKIRSKKEASFNNNYHYQETMILR